MRGGRKRGGSRWFKEQSISARNQPESSFVCSMAGNTRTQETLLLKEGSIIGEKQDIIPIRRRVKWMEFVLPLCPL